MIELAAQKAGWKAGAQSDGTSGPGFAFSQYKNGYGYFAAVVDLSLEPDDGAGQYRHSEPDNKLHPTGFGFKGS